MLREFGGYFEHHCFLERPSERYHQRTGNIHKEKAYIFPTKSKKGKVIFFRGRNHEHLMWQGNGFIQKYRKKLKYFDFP
jgi:hypothetical protein